MTVEKSFKTAETFDWSPAKVEDFSGAYSRMNILLEFIVTLRLPLPIGRGRLDGKATETMKGSYEDLYCSKLCVYNRFFGNGGS